MPFTNTWDATFESQPADSEDINLGANRIRALKVAIRERMQVDHEWEDAQQDGKHNKITLVAQAAVPSISGTDGFLYTQYIGGSTELFYRDANGNIIQLTELGRLFPYASNDFSVAADLAVGGGVTVGEVISFAAGHVTGFAAFATPDGDTVLQFSAVNGGSWLYYQQLTGQMHLVVGGVVVQTWP